MIVQPDREPDDPLSRFSLAVFRLNGLLTRNGDRLTKSVGQSSARWQVLGRAGFRPQTVAQMARDLGHARQSVQRITDVLAREGLVRYRDNPADRRAQLVELTAKGERALMGIYASYGRWSEQIMTKLSASQLERAADTMAEIAQILEEDINE